MARDKASQIRSSKSDKGLQVLWTMILNSIFSISVLTELLLSILVLKLGDGLLHRHLWYQGQYVILTAALHIIIQPVPRLLLLPVLTFPLSGTLNHLLIFPSNYSHLFLDIIYNSSYCFLINKWSCQHQYIPKSQYSDDEIEREVYLFSFGSFVLFCLGVLTVL